MVFIVCLHVCLYMSCEDMLEESIGASGNELYWQLWAQNGSWESPVSSGRAASAHSHCSIASALASFAFDDGEHLSMCSSFTTLFTDFCEFSKFIIYYLSDKFPEMCIISIPDYDSFSGFCWMMIISCALSKLMMYLKSICTQGELCEFGFVWSLPFVVCLQWLRHHLLVSVSSLVCFVHLWQDSVEHICLSLSLDSLHYSIHSWDSRVHYSYGAGGLNVDLALLVSKWFAPVLLYLRYL